MLNLRKRLLIVDDEPSFTRLLQLNFHHTGRYNVEVVNDAAKAVQAAERFTPDIILMDVMMPGMDGGEVANQIHAIARFRNTPIVFITAAVGRKELASRDGRCGGIPFVAKPVDFDEVLEHVDRECGLKKYV